MFEYEEDVRWCANVALGCSFILMMVGVIFSAYLEDGREYSLVMFSLLALLFLSAGVGLHIKVKRDISRRTITTLTRDRQ